MSQCVLQLRNGTLDAIISRNSFAFQYGFPVERSPTISQSEFFFVSRYPKPINSHFLYINPFSREVWTFCLLALLAGLFTTALLSWAFGDSLSMEILFLVATLTNETYLERNLKLHSYFSARNAFVITWLPALTLLTMAYCSNLRASLLKVEFEPPIDTFEDILNNNITAFFLSGGGPFEQLMKTSPREVVRRTYYEVSEWLHLHFLSTFVVKQVICLQKN